MSSESARLRIALMAVLALAGLDAARSVAARLAVASSTPRLAAPLAEGTPPAASVDSEIERGRYLTESGLCGHCHTPVDADGTPLPGLHLGGGTRFISWPFGVYVSGNLTSDAATGLGAWSDAEIVRALREGHTPDRALDTIVMPSVLYASYGTDDANAIVRYLRSLPAVVNAAPSPIRYGVVETLVGKLLFFGGAIPAHQVLATGNFGRAEAGPDLAEAVLALLRWLQLAVLVGAVFSGLRAVGRPPFPWLVVATAVAFVAWVVVRFPALPFVSAVSIRDALFPVPSLATGGLAPEDVARLEHGRSVYLTSGCAVCHGLDGAEPIRLAWNVFGSVTSANLTPHSSGLAGIDDARFERALRTGRAADGHEMHWRAMPWTRFAAMSRRDSRDLLAFLRALPPVACTRPAPRPPSAGDPVDLTVSFDATSDCGGEG